MQSKVTIELNLDWALLDEQKKMLVNVQSAKVFSQPVNELIEGILQIFDSIQDQAEEQGHPVYQHISEETDS